MLEELEQADICGRQGMVQAAKCRISTSLSLLTNFFGLIEYATGCDHLRKLLHSSGKLEQEHS